ncbi:hypothetical protein FC54_GL001428 [Ligilactobacillus saerimneri DSM 16049]|nr:hypothetical protein FC54_GL001428 [Ligilactobacillus saerimneri DSM 16049]
MISPLSALQINKAGEKILPPHQPYYLFMNGTDNFAKKAISAHLFAILFKG